MTLQEKNLIVEWLYLNDGGYPSKTEWRKALVKMLDGIIAREIEMPPYDSENVEIKHECNSKCGSASYSVD